MLLMVTGGCFLNKYQLIGMIGWRGWEAVSDLHALYVYGGAVVLQTRDKQRETKRGWILLPDVYKIK